MARFINDKQPKPYSRHHKNPVLPEVIERLVEIPVEKIVVKEVRVEVPVEKIIYKESETPSPITKIVYKDKIIEVEKRVEVKVEVPVPFQVTQEVHRIPKLVWLALGLETLALLYLLIKG